MKVWGEWEVWKGWGEGLMVRAMVIKSKNHTLIQQRRGVEWVVTYRYN
jgi:hypothetical protein